MPKLTKNKSELSISLSNDIIIYISKNFKNRSKFIEYCIINELIKYNKYKNIINEKCEN